MMKSAAVLAVLVIALTVTTFAEAEEKIARCVTSRPIHRLCRWCHNDMKLEGTYGNCCRENPHVLKTCQDLYAEVHQGQPDGVGSL